MLSLPSDQVTTLKLLKPIQHEIKEDPLVRQVPHEVGIFNRHTEWKDVPNPDPQVNLTLYVTKKQGYTWQFPHSVWLSLAKQIAQGVVFMGHALDRSGDKLFFYAHLDRFYVTRAELQLTDVPLIIESESKKKTEKVQKELEMIRAAADGRRLSREPIPEKVQVMVWNRDRGRCVKCGSTELLEFDHIIPVSKGGANTARNLQVLCQKCNRAKRASIGG